MKRIYPILILLFTGLPFMKSQDTLSLNQVLERIITTYPSMPQAQEAIKSAEARVAIAKATYLPTLSGSASYLWLDPISKLTLNNHSFNIQPHHNLDFGVTLNQLLWDFGKNRPKVEAAQLQRKITELQKQQVRQNLLLQGIRNYYMTAYARHSIDIKIEELSDYGKQLEQTAIRKQSGSATEFNYLNTHVSFSAVEAELTALKAVKETQYVNLSVLADTVINDNTLLSLDFAMPREERTLDDLISYAFGNRPEMLITQTEYELARQQEKSASRMYNPDLSMSASTGFKNGYEPDLNESRFNYSAGATLEIPIYTGGLRKQQKNIAVSDAQKALLTIEMMKREVTQTVSDNYYSLISSAARIGQLSAQVNLAEKTYQQAQVNFKAGSITNLELLTSITNKSNARLLLLQEKINFEITYYQLLQNIGMDLFPSR